LLRGAGAGRLLLALVAVAPGHAHAAEVSIHAARSGNTLEVQASAEFEGSLSRAWRVLTDYDHLPRFMPHLEVSRVLSRERGRLLVEQRGAARLLIFSYPVHVPRRSRHSLQKSSGGKSGDG
jgi:uncharacterized membrane protein